MQKPARVQLGECLQRTRSWTQHSQQNQNMANSQKSPSCPLPVITRPLLQVHLLREGRRSRIPTRVGWRAPLPACWVRSVRSVSSFSALEALVTLAMHSASGTSRVFSALLNIGQSTCKRT
ncbi:psychosine receptor isoform X2 [Ursus maritimus]|uniref:Psychosine receptor isoform X2 n=1 Tax=Ursus maritimus TaxID=29073 RepID=A0A8M1GP72_URSMA|nr:psychosine receptor isoform X2 [Ursus maritimus]